jgi:hypothetical protein
MPDPAPVTRMVLELSVIGAVLFICRRHELQSRPALAKGKRRPSRPGEFSFPQTTVSERLLSFPKLL